MNLEFDLRHVETTVFGLGRSVGGDRTFGRVPSDDSVQLALIDMVRETQELATVDGVENSQYDPANKYSSTEYAHLPLDHDLARPFAAIHGAKNLSRTHGIEARDMADVFCYFAQFVDATGRKITGLRRSAQFKGMLKKPTYSFVRDSLRLNDSPVFQLNSEFDVLVDSQRVHVIHPASFKILGQIDEAIARAVGTNIDKLTDSAPFVEWYPVAEYAGGSPRAAALLASIVSAGYAVNVDPEKLVRSCQVNGVDVIDRNGTIEVDANNMLGFLEVLDRRRYDVDLASDPAEHYRAGSRQRVRPGS